MSDTVERSNLPLRISAQYISDPTHKSSVVKNSDWGCAASYLLPCGDRMTLGGAVNDLSNLGKEVSLK